MDKIGTFQKFVNEVGNRFNVVHVFHNGADLTLSMTDIYGRDVKQFIHFRRSNPLLDSRTCREGWI